jgi:hypothetical protein
MRVFQTQGIILLFLIEIESTFIFHRVHDDSKNLSPIKVCLMFALFTIISMIIGIIVVCLTSQNPGNSSFQLLTFILSIFS